MPKPLLWNLRRFRECTAQYRNGAIECPHPPVRLWIEPTNVCNLRCISCPTGRGHVHAPGRMPLDLYRAVIDEAAGFAVDINLIGRGEAFLHPEIGEMVRYAHDRGLSVRLESNATVLTADKSEAVIRAGLDFISFSIDGYVKETYEAIRRGAVFEQSIGNVVGFLETKRRLRSRKPYAIIQLIRTRPFLETATRANRKRFRRMFRGLPLNAYRYVTPHRYVGEIEEEITGSRYGYMKRTDGGGLLKLRYTPCPYLWMSMHVLWDGTVAPCCMDFHGRFILGSVRESTLLEIWNGEPIRSLREKIASRRHGEVPLCAGCDLLRQTTLAGVSTKNIRDFNIFLRENIVR
ncbi:MAG: radical SAM/SPASM domain-containing protein [bacterium]|nr:radical SAM/SPASM domain-containing protein [bacterium]